MIKSFVYLSSLLAVGAVCFSCSNNEEIVRNVEPPSQKIWTASLKATGKDIGGLDDTETSTRAIFYGGNTGHRFYFVWDTGDFVDIYKGDTKLGRLIPSTYGERSTTLTGELTGALEAGDALNLYLPARAYDYRGQNATMATLSSTFAFQESSTTVLEAKESGNTLSLNATALDHAQAYFWLRLTDENGNRLHPMRLQLYTSSGKMVKTKAIDGTTTYFTEEDPMDIIINKEEDNGEYPGEAFIAIRNESGVADTYKFKAWVGEDIYIGPYDRALNYKVTHGNMSNVKRQMRKTTAVSTLTVADIPSRVFTGSAYEPTLTVTDGEDALMLNTDYSVSYADNVNVGTATATVTGLADAGAVAATKYLGTKDKTFQITQATPVITMPTEDEMTLEVGLTRQRAVTSVTLDNSAFSLADLDIMAAPYNCTITYSSANPTIATVSSDGTVTGVATGTTTITVTVAEAQNWTSQTKTYTVKVSPRVNTSGNATWTVTEDAESGNVYQ